MFTWSTDHPGLVTFEAVSEDASIQGLKSYFEILRCQSAEHLREAHGTHMAYCCPVVHSKHTAQAKAAQLTQDDE